MIYPANRRQFIAHLSKIMLGHVVASPLRLQAQTMGTPKRLIHIFLSGAWNAQLSTDPVYGERAASGNFEGVYNTLEVAAPSEKPQLMTGAGFIPALAAFGKMPTAFVNGLYVDAPAHDSARDFMYTGKSTIGEATPYPALAAIIGTSAYGFPAHLVLGSRIPLGSTAKNAPPLVAGSIDALSALILGPGAGFTAEAMEEQGRLIRSLDEKFYSSLSNTAQDSLSAWRKAQQQMDALYLKGYAQTLQFTDSIKEAYAIANNFSLEASFATAFLAQKADLARIVSINFGSFDTHNDEIGSQLPLQIRVANALNALVADLTTTPDPAIPSTSLADTTTLLISSEFVRTPKFNGASGTDHWRSASAILMGRGVKDSVVGATDTFGEALGWRAGGPQPASAATYITFANLIATVLSIFGLDTEAEKISKERLDVTS